MPVAGTVNKRPKEDKIMYKDKFVLSIIHDGHPVREFGGRSEKEVALPFDSEYKIRLKNKNNRGCTARVFIDDKQVSKLGDFIINANGTIDLERFVGSSLDRGKKFKFVPLDHPDVDDPTSSDNGIIKVEFRLARKENGIKVNVGPVTWKPWDWADYPYPSDVHPSFTSDPPRDGSTGNGFVYGDNTRTDGQVSVSYCCSNFVSDGARVAKASPHNVKDGATIEGGRSNQSFVYSDLDVEDFPTTILQLKIVGIKDTKQADKLIYRYCSKCGSKVKREDRFCRECGKKL